MSKLKLRSYQIQDSQSIIDNWKDYSSILYQLPTGGGKTIVIQNIVEKFKDKKILILVHKREIIFQIHERLKEQGIKSGILIGNFQENIDCNILIGSILTVVRDGRLQGVLDRNDDIMIIDEAHHACSNSYEKVIKIFKSHNKNYKLLGVTATPYRKDKKRLKHIFDVMITGPSIPELQEQGYLCYSTCFASKLEDLNFIEKSGGDYNITSLSKFMSNPTIIQHAINSYKSKGNNKQMLVFCVNKKHAHQVQEQYIKSGYDKIGYIDSHTKDSERDKTILDFREKKIDILISIQTLTEGVDLPDAGVIQLLRPTLSLVLYLQMVGRGLRPKQDGENLIILDIANCSREHGLVDSYREWTLNQKDPNLKRRKNKIVGKRKDGTYSENEEEIEKEGLELIELTPEEYLVKVNGGIEEAKRKNEEIGEKINQILLNIEKYLEDNLKELKFYHDENNTKKYNIYGAISVKTKSSNSSFFSIKFSKSKISMEKDWWGYHDDELEKWIIGGKLAEFLSNKTKMRKIVEMWLECSILEDEMINIDKIEKQIKEFNEMQLEIQIDNLIRNGQYEFELSESFNSRNYFRDMWGWYNKIVFLNSPSKLKVINEIEYLLVENGKITRRQTMNTKKEKILEIIIKKKLKQ